MRKLMPALLAGSLLVSVSCQSKDYTEDSKKMALFIASVDCARESGELIGKYAPEFYKYDFQDKETYRVQDSKTTKVTWDVDEMVKECEIGKNP